MQVATGLLEAVLGFLFVLRLKFNSLMKFISHRTKRRPVPASSTDGCQSDLTGTDGVHLTDVIEPNDPRRGVGVLFNDFCQMGGERRKLSLCASERKLERAACITSQKSLTCWQQAHTSLESESASSAKFDALRPETRRRRVFKSLLNLHPCEPRLLFLAFLRKAKEPGNFP